MALKNIPISWRVVIGCTLKSLNESQCKLKQEHDQNCQMDEMPLQNKYYDLNILPGF